MNRHHHFRHFLRTQELQELVMLNKLKKLCAVGQWNSVRKLNLRIFMQVIPKFKDIVSILELKGIYFLIGTDNLELFSH
jgi:hypothetical protein